MEIIKKDKRFGKYLIKNVPHFQNDSIITTDIVTDMVLADIIEYLDQKEETVFDYQEWIQIW